MNVSSYKSSFVSEGIQRALTSVEKFVAAAQQKHNDRKTMSALNALDDRELEDIGLVRADIEKTVQNIRH